MCAYSTITVQLQYSYSTVTVQLQYSYSTVTVQLQYSYSTIYKGPITSLVCHGGGGGRRRSIKLCGYVHLQTVARVVAYVMAANEVMLSEELMIAGETFVCDYVGAKVWGQHTCTHKNTHTHILSLSLSTGNSCLCELCHCLQNQFVPSCLEVSKFILKQLDEDSADLSVEQTLTAVKLAVQVSQSSCTG